MVLKTLVLNSTTRLNISMSLHEVVKHTACSRSLDYQKIIYINNNYHS